MSPEMRVMAGLPPCPCGDFGEVSAVGGWFDCFAFDVGAWQEKNRVPLYQGQWQRWLLAVSNRKALNDPQIEKEVFYFLQLFFDTVQKKNQYGGFPTPGSVFGGSGDVDNLRVLGIGPFADLESLVAKEGWETKMSATDLPQAERLYFSGPTTSVLVEFVYRGGATDMPWPAYNPAASGLFCPIDPDMALTRVYLPSKTEVPTEPTFGSRLSEVATEAKDAASDALTLSPSTKLAILLGVAALGFGAIMASKLAK